MHTYDTVVEFYSELELFQKNGVEKIKTNFYVQ
jgi:hypothetical protein